jgi:hypothetical protein
MHNANLAARLEEKAETNKINITKSLNEQKLTLESKFNAHIASIQESNQEKIKEVQKQQEAELKQKFELQLAADKEMLADKLELYRIESLESHSRKLEKEFVEKLKEKEEFLFERFAREKQVLVIKKEQEHKEQLSKEVARVSKDKENKHQLEVKRLESELSENYASKEQKISNDLRADYDAKIYEMQREFHNKIDKMRLEEQEKAKAHLASALKQQANTLSISSEREKQALNDKFTQTLAQEKTNAVKNKAQELQVKFEEEKELMVASIQREYANNFEQKENELRERLDSQLEDKVKKIKSEAEQEKSNWYAEKEEALQHKYNDFRNEVQYEFESKLAQEIESKEKLYKERLDEKIEYIKADLEKENKAENSRLVKNIEQKYKKIHETNLAAKVAKINCEKDNEMQNFKEKLEQNNVIYLTKEKESLLNSLQEEFDNKEKKIILELEERHEQQLHATATRQRLEADNERLEAISVLKENLMTKHSEEKEKLKADLWAKAASERQLAVENNEKKVRELLYHEMVKQKEHLQEQAQARQDTLLTEERRKLVNEYEDKISKIYKKHQTDLEILASNSNHLQSDNSYSTAQTTKELEDDLRNFSVNSNFSSIVTENTAAKQGALQHNNKQIEQLAAGILSKFKGVNKERK